jgi:hypothetical protein
MSKANDENVLLTADQVLQWKKELKSVVEDLSRLTTRRQFLEHKLRAVDALMIDPESEATWNGYLKDILLWSKQRALSEHQFKPDSAAIAEAAITAAELVKSGDPTTNLIKRWRLLADDRMFEEESMGAAILNILATVQLPLENEAIRASLSVTPKFQQSLTNNPNYYYTVMNRLEKRGEVTKIGKRWILTPRLEPPAGETAGESEKED